MKCLFHYDAGILKEHVHTRVAAGPIRCLSYWARSLFDPGWEEWKMLPDHSSHLCQLILLVSRKVVSATRNLRLKAAGFKMI